MQTINIPERAATVAYLLWRGSSAIANTHTEMMPHGYSSALTASENCTSLSWSSWMSCAPSGRPYTYHGDGGKEMSGWLFLWLLPHLPGSFSNYSEMMM